MQIEEPIFLKLSHKYHYLSASEEHVFGSINDSEHYRTNEVIQLADPSIDATFKFLFTDHQPKILENMLNSIFFPNAPQLEDLKILNNEVSKPDQKQNKGTIRSDIACKAKFNGKTIIIGIEMQIGSYFNFAQKLHKYNIGLCYKYNFYPSWTEGLFINIENEPKYSSYIK